MPVPPRSLVGLLPPIALIEPRVAGGLAIHVLVMPWKLGEGILGVDMEVF